MEQKDGGRENSLCWTAELGHQFSPALRLGTYSVSNPGSQAFGTAPLAWSQLTDGGASQLP